MAARLVLGRYEKTGGYTDMKKYIDGISLSPIEHTQA